MDAMPIAGAVKAARANASQKSFYPIATVKCEGPRVFRSQAARDLACLLDVDRGVSSWISMPAALSIGADFHIPDFAVFGFGNRVTLVDASDRCGQFDNDQVSKAAERAGYGYRAYDDNEVYNGCRLRNAKDLLRYGNHKTPLGDRFRLLAALDDQGTLTFAECLTAFRETDPVPGLASLILWDFLDVDLDHALIGPETSVRRIRN